MCGLLCVAICRGTMCDDTLQWMHLMVSNTAWRRYARLRAADHLEDEEAVRGGQRHDTRYEWRQDAAEHEISSHD